jgi:CHAT domain-containing protein/tetratricopeptide (TPR) repeat protein
VPDDADALIDAYYAARQRHDADGQIEILRSLLSIAQQSGNRIGEIEVLRWMGNALQDKGLLQKAHAYRVTAERLMHELGEECPPVLRMSVEGDLGRSFIETKEWNAAESHTREALRMAEELEHEEGLCIYNMNLARVLTASGKVDEAIRRGKEVLAIAERRRDHYVLGIQHLNLAGIYLQQLQLNQSQRHARLALAHADVTGNPDLRSKAHRLIGESYRLGRLLSGRHEYAAEAIHFLTGMLESARVDGDAATEAETHLQLARVNADLRKSPEAAKHYRASLEALERVRKTLGYESFHLSYFRSLQPAYDEITQFLLRQGRVEQALHTSEMLRSRLLLAMFGQSRSSTPAWSRQAQNDLTNVMDAYGGEILRLFRGEERGRGLTITRGGDDGAPRNPRIDAAHAAFLRLHESQALHSALWTSQQVPPPETLETIRSTLRRDEALIVYHVTDSSLIAFAVTDDGVHFQHLPYSEQRLASDVAAVCEAISDLRKPEPRDGLQWLYALLIAPLLHTIATKKHWTIVPHGPLHRVPWAALHSLTGYLIEEHSVSILPSAGFGVAVARQLEPTGRDAVFFGNPDPGDEWLKLPGSEVEVTRSWETLATGQPPFLGPNATKAEVLRRARSARLLHVAAHHMFDAEVPLLSFLKLAGDRGSDFLYAIEVMDLNLSAQLVTLSACETARSRIDTGDEQYGMVRGFLAAGARSVMSTLWKIHDLSAAKLIADFYERAKNDALGNALAGAQRALLAIPHYRLPYFWAPYVLSGEWKRPLTLT